MYMREGHGEEVDELKIKWKTICKLKEFVDDDFYFLIGNITFI